MALSGPPSSAAATALAPAPPTQRVPWIYVRDALWGLRIVAAVAILAASGNLPVIWQQLAFLVGMMALTSPVRGVRAGTVYTFFLIGLLWAFVIVGIQYVIEILVLGERFELFRSTVVAPMTEEPLKLMPLVLCMAVGRWRFRHSFGACDLMLLGGALGAGFGFFEQSLYGHPFLGTPIGPEVFGWVLLPDSIGGYVGHGAATALVGLALGWAVYGLRFSKLLAATQVVFVAFLGWMVVDHAMVNWSVSAGPEPLLLRFVWALDGRGHATPYVFLVLVVATVIAERILLSRMLRPFPRLGPGRCLRALVAPLRKGFGYSRLRAAVMRGKTILLYVLAMRQLGYLRAHTLGDRPVDREAIARSTARRAIEVIAAQRAIWTAS